MSRENAEPHSNESISSENGPDASDALSPLELKVSELEEALTEEKNKYLYLYADFDNFKKRSIKERSETLKFGWENIARDLLGVLDNLDRAIEHMPPNTEANWKTGIEMTAVLFRSTLEKQGVAQATSVGAVFNPELHEAVGTEPSDQPSGTITQTLMAGYTLHGRLLRPAKVVVSSGPKV